MIPKSLSLLSLAGAMAFALAATTAGAQTVRLHGGTGPAKALLARQVALEKQAGVSVEIVGNGAGHGLADLAKGEADIALLAGPLEGVAADINLDQPGVVSTAGLVVTPANSAPAIFCTHPGVGLKSIGDAQLRDVLSGKITNWKDVGGPDLPIKLVLATRGDGARVTFQTQFLQGAPYLATAIVRATGKDVTAIVAKLPGACAVVGKYNLTGEVASVSLESPCVITWALVTKGIPAGDIKKVVEAATPMLKP